MLAAKSRPAAPLVMHKFQCRGGCLAFPCHETCVHQLLMVFRADRASVQLSAATQCLRASMLERGSKGRGGTPVTGAASVYPGEAPGQPRRAEQQPNSRAEGPTRNPIVAMTSGAPGCAQQILSTAALTLSALTGQSMTVTDSPPFS